MGISSFDESLEYFSTQCDTNLMILVTKVF